MCNNPSGTVDMACGPDVPESEIIQEVNRTESYAIKLGDLLSRLDNKLSYISSGSSPCVEVNSKNASRISGLAARLQNINSEIQCRVNYLEDIINRIQL